MAAAKKKKPALPPHEYPDRLPDAVEAEQALLGAILVDNTCYWGVADFLSHTHFIEQPHQVIYEVMSQMIAEARPVTPITLKAYLPVDTLIGSPESETPQLTMFEYVVTLLGEAVSTQPTVVREMGRAIIEMWSRHQLVALCRDYDTLARNMPAKTTPEKVIQEMAVGLVKIVQESNSRRGAYRYGVLLPKAITKAAHASENKTSIPWFLPEISQTAGDIRPGNLIGLMSDSGGGKSSMALQQCRHAALHGFKTGFYSIEITEEEAAIQTAAQAAGIELGRIDSYSMNEKERAKLEAEMERSVGLPLDIVPFADAKLSDIQIKAEAAKRDGGLDLIAIDHAKMITLPGKPGELFAERIMALYRGLKALAKSLEIGVVILIQRNEEWKQRFFKGGSLRPMMGDAYGGGSVRQALDVWFSLYRPEPLYKELIHQEIRQEKRDELVLKYERSRGKAWIINHKRRRGEPGTAMEVLFEAEYTRFSSPNAMAAPMIEGLEAYDG